MSFPYQLANNKALKDSHLERLISAVTQGCNRSLSRGTKYTYIRDCYIILILLHTGLRNAELRSLRLRDIDLRDLTLTVVNGKGGKTREFYISPDTAHLIKQYILHKASILREGVGRDDHLFVSTHYKPYTSNGLWQRVKYWMKQAGLPDHYTVHSLRHTHACLSLESGEVPLTQIQQNLGHSDRSTTEVYIHMRRNGMPNINFTGVKSKKIRQRRTNPRLLRVA